MNILQIFCKYYAADHFKHAVARLNCKLSSKCPYQLMLFADSTLYYEDLLEKAVRVKMRVSRLTVPCIEIYKTINSLNPSLMKSGKRVVNFWREVQGF